MNKIKTSPFLLEKLTRLSSVSSKYILKMNEVLWKQGLELNWTHIWSLFSSSTLHNDLYFGQVCFFLPYRAELAEHPSPWRTSSIGLYVHINSLILAVCHQLCLLPLFLLKCSYTNISNFPFNSIKALLWMANGN